VMLHGVAVDSRRGSRAGPALRVGEIGDPQRWDRFVAGAREGTFAHLWGWREIMGEVLGHESAYLAATDQAGDLHGVLPVVRVRTILGHYVISVPFLNAGGPIGTAAARQALVDRALEIAQAAGASLLELRAREEIPGLWAAHPKVAVHLRLPESVETLWSSTFRAKLRSQVRRPAREGMTFREGSDQLAAFYDVFARNMRDLGTPVLPRAFFERISTVFGERVMFGAVSTREGTPAASACCLLWRDGMEVMWASSLRRLKHLAPNMLLYASLMESAIRRGIRLFDFGRSTPGTATHRFKQQWGGYDVPLAWPTWSRTAGAARPSVDRPLYSLAVAAWSHLPLGVANRIGPVLARMLP
jgi:serine/alanine adding enzyme